MKHLSDLLGHKHPLFAYNIVQLERAAGRPGIDVRLLADCTYQAHQIIRQLRFDATAGVRAVELYTALIAAVKSAQAKQLIDKAQYVLLRVEDHTISFNLQDLLADIENNSSFENRSLEHARRQLRAELVRRYAEHDRTDDMIVRRLVQEAGIVRPEDEPNSYINNTSKNEEPDMNGQTPHILCVGDIITNAFIKLSKDHAEETTDEQGYKRLSFELGAKLPYDQVDIVEAVECSPNAAVSLNRLGLSTSLMSWLGDDDPGKSMIKYLEKEGVGTDELVVEAGVKSNYHYVLRYGADRTKLQRFEDYSYQWKEPSRKPDWLYLGVLGENTWPLHEAILGYLESNPEVKLAFQPGMYHLMWGADKMAEFYRHAEVVIMNREEAAEVTGQERGDIGVLLDSLHELGVNVAVVTDGPDGAYASDRSRKLFMPNYPDSAPPYDRTGAGDAFASTLVAALALGEGLETALEWAPINSMNVVQQLGAQAGLQTRQQIAEWLSKAPADYNVQAM